MVFTVVAGPPTVPRTGTGLNPFHRRSSEYRQRRPALRYADARTIPLCGDRTKV